MNTYNNKMTSGNYLVLDANNLKEAIHNLYHDPEPTKGLQTFEPSPNTDAYFIGNFNSYTLWHDRTSNRLLISQEPLNTQTVYTLESQSYLTPQLNTDTNLGQYQSERNLWYVGIGGYGNFAKIYLVIAGWEHEAIDYVTQEEGDDFDPELLLWVEKVKPVSLLRSEIYQWKENATTFTIDQLSDRAKQSAISEHWDWNVGHDWWESTYEHIKQIGEAIGISFESDKFYFDIDRGSYFRCDATLHAEDLEGAFERINAYAPNLAEGLESYKDKWSYQYFKSIKEFTQKYARYYKWAFGDVIATCHSHGDSISTKYDTYNANGEDETNVESYLKEMEADLEEILSDFLQYCLTRLRNEYEYLTSAEAIEESLQANEYVFDVNGNLK